ncbi:MAG TPA: ammonia channel protein, partial [Rhodocyclaceae bacterium]|nr:ammonia channel protein [Rhodocyclaceae bacterium]
MKKLFAIFVTALTLGLSGTASAQDASAPAVAASAPVAAATATPTAAATPAADASAPVAAPTPNKGDVAWMLTSTALVLLMSVPALALFYGGLVRTKNMLSVLMQVFVVFSLIVVLWCIYGYSLAFTEGSGSLSAFIGGFSRLFLNGTFDAATG